MLDVPLADNPALNKTGSFVQVYLWKRLAASVH